MSTITQSTVSEGNEERHERMRKNLAHVDLQNTLVTARPATSADLKSDQQISPEDEQAMTHCQSEIQWFRQCLEKDTPQPYHFGYNHEDDRWDCILYNIKADCRTVAGRCLKGVRSILRF